MRLVGQLLGILLAGCGMVPEGDTIGGMVPAGDSTGGMGVPQQFPTEAFPGERSPMTARVHLTSNGCFLGSLPDTGPTSRYLIVWPDGTEQGSSGTELRLRDGTVVRHRDLLEGEGLLMPTGRLEGFDQGSYWESAVDFCSPGTSDVLVLDSVVKR